METVIRESKFHQSVFKHLDIGVYLLSLVMYDKRHYVESERCRGLTPLVEFEWWS